MKYVEPIKSIFLTFLVLLSIYLTFLIWNYEPEYEFLEKTDAEQVAIGQETIGGEKSFRDVVRPYKTLFMKDEVIYGSVSVNTIEQMIDLLSVMELGNIRLAQDNANAKVVNNLMYGKNQSVLFFNTTIPLETLNTVLNFNQKDIENVQFDRIVMEMSNLISNGTVELRFINTKANVVYRATATVENEQNIARIIEEQIKDSFEYIRVNREGELALFLPKNPSDVIQFTYIIEEMSQDELTSALFTNASILQKTSEGNQDKYIGAMSLMTFDKASKTMNFVNSQAESSQIDPAGKLLNDTFNFVNDHGGFTADFRVSSIDPVQKSVEYQLFFQGHPIYSTSILTRIVTTWGENSIFRYRRPYYQLDTDITSEKMIKQLESGEEVLEYLNEKIASPNSVEDVMIGYYLVPDSNPRLFVLQPSWFAVSDNSWTRLTSQTEGGIERGLE